MEIHEKLKHYRIKNGLTQSELSNELNISRQSISKWENGTIIPSIDNLKSLSSLYKVSLDDLLDNKPIVKDESISLLVITVVCALLPIADLIGPIYVIKQNKKTNQYYKLLNFLNCACFVLAIISYVFIQQMASKF